MTTTKKSTVTKKSTATTSASPRMSIFTIAPGRMPPKHPMTTSTRPPCLRHSPTSTWKMSECSTTSPLSGLEFGLVVPGTSASSVGGTGHSTFFRFCPMTTGRSTLATAGPRQTCVALSGWNSSGCIMTTIGPFDASAHQRGPEVWQSARGGGEEGKEGGEEGMEFRG